MTKIDIFSGFLGAGKTTLIKKLIAEAYAGEKLVLIENEFGEINIDGGFLKESGIEISEMSAGCICCSLVGDFNKALREVVEQFRMPFAFHGYDFRLLREMFGFTVYVFIGIVVDNVNWSIDRQLLTWFHGSAAVTVYSIAAQLNNYFLLFGNAISNVMTPRVHRLVAEGASMRKLDALFTCVGRLQFILLSCIFLGFVAIGQSFVVLWGGGEQFRIDYWTTLLLFFACLWTNVQTVGIEIQRAKNMHKFRSLTYLGVLVGNILISIPLCIKWQGLGAAIGTAIATLVGNVILMNWYYYHRIGLNIPAFWRHILHLTPSMLLPAAAAVLLAVFVHPTTYWGLIPPGLAFVAVYGISVWLFGMNRYERGLVTGPLRRLTRRRKRGGGHRAP